MEDTIYIHDHPKEDRLHLEIYGYLATLGDGNGGKQTCLVCSNSDVSRMGELVNAGGVTTSSILGRRLLITIEDAKP